MIVGYRKQLGGFYKVEQLQDIHLPVDKLCTWFSVEEGGTLRMNLNKTEIERLKAHPYINFYPGKSHRRVSQEERKNTKSGSAEAL